MVGYKLYGHFSSRKATTKCVVCCMDWQPEKIRILLCVYKNHTCTFKYSGFGIIQIYVCYHSTTAIIKKRNSTEKRQQSSSRRIYCTTRVFATIPVYLACGSCLHCCFIMYCIIICSMFIFL